MSLILIWSVALCKTHESNFRALRTFISCHAKKGRSYWMSQYDQSWFENMWLNRQNTVFYELWEKQFRIEPVTFEYPLNLIAQNRIKWHKIQENNRRWKTSGCSIIENINRNSYRTISKRFGISEQSFQIFTRIAACSLANVFL